MMMLYLKLLSGMERSSVLMSLGAIERSCFMKSLSFQTAGPDALKSMANVLEK
jgi:hypothetical protein